MFLLAKGKNKDEVLANALRESQNINEFPIDFSLGKIPLGNWIMIQERH